jgi:hypothetical protein
VLLFLQLLTIAGMTGVTYLIFQSFGCPRRTLLYTKQEKDEWDAVIAKPLGTWFTTTNIIGTLTLFATVYLFFIGSARLFGIWIFACTIAIWGGSYVTNFFTQAVCSDKYIVDLLNCPDQTGGVIASVFWRPTVQARKTAGLIKIISLLNIASIIWLDFALFADISGQLLGIQHLAWRTLLLAICCFAVCYFTFRYGLRGFVFVDLFQSPVIALASLVLLVGAGLLTFSARDTLIHGPQLHTLFSHALSTKECMLFTIHVAFVNLFLVLVTEPHWLRLWVFREKETILQVRSLAWTAGIWIVLILVGFMASFASGGKTGEQAIVGLLSKLNGISPVFLVVFWLGGMACLFSSADAQIYSFLVVREFDVTTGKLRTRLMETLQPLYSSTIIAVLFGCAYFGVRILNIPFEKIVFLIMPLSLNIFPAFVLASKGLPQNPSYLRISLALYAACAIFGLRQPTNSYFWTLSAALMPLVVGAFEMLFSGHLRRRNLDHAVEIIKT